MVITCYKVQYKMGVSKAKKQAFVFAKNKKQAIEAVKTREGRYQIIGCKADSWNLHVVESGFHLPYIEKIEWVVN